MAAQHVQTRQRPDERAWEMFQRQYRVHLRRPESVGAVSTIARQLSRGVSRRHARPCACGGRRRAARARPLGRWPRRSGHSRDGLDRTDSDQGREEASGLSAPRWRPPGASKSASFRTRWRSRIKTGLGPKAEHFGFADPISQPPIEGADTPSYPGDGVLEPDGTWRPLKPGEFLLGYEDEVGPEGTRDSPAARTAAERNVHGVPPSFIKTWLRSDDTW